MRALSAACAAGAVLIGAAAVDCRPASAQTFGAIALGGDGITQVYSGEFPSMEAARAEALRKCTAAIVRRYGRQVSAFTECAVWVSFGNGCGAVTDRGGRAAGAGGTLEEAKAQAMERCQKVSKRCRIGMAECAGG
jgi:hypothetical protein